MKNSPCATFTIRMTPRTSERPMAVSAITSPETTPSRRPRKRCPVKLMTGAPTCWFSWPLPVVPFRDRRACAVSFLSPVSVTGKRCSARPRKASRTDRRQKASQRNLERLRGVVALRLVHAVLDPGPVDDLESPVLHLRDELLAERLVQAAHELLRALRVPVAFVEPLKPLQSFNERAVVLGAGLLIA